MTQKCGFIALLGRTNAGKSTLMNRLVGAKVSIVSRKVQTTRRRILGIQVHDESQLIFIDTPGLFAPRRSLDKTMIKSAWSSLEEADLILVLVDAQNPDIEAHQSLLARAQKAGKPLYLILNKIDRVDKQKLLQLAADLNQGRSLEKTFMISALRNQGVEDLLKDLSQSVPEGPWHYPGDQLTDLPLRLMVAEMTREHVFDKLHQELPYSIAVETEVWEPFENGSIKIGQVIHVQKPNQKSIVLGKKGETVKRISSAARRDMESFLEKPVHLFLHVRVTENWTQDQSQFEARGL